MYDIRRITVASPPLVMHTAPAARVTKSLAPIDVTDASTLRGRTGLQGTVSAPTLVVRATQALRVIRLVTAIDRANTLVYRYALDVFGIAMPTPPLIVHGAQSACVVRLVAAVDLAAATKGGAGLRALRCCRRYLDLALRGTGPFHGVHLHLRLQSV